MILALFEHPEGLTLDGGACVVYDLERGEARFGCARVAGPALAWCVARDREALVTDCYKGSESPVLQVDVELEPTREPLVTDCYKGSESPVMRAELDPELDPGLERDGDPHRGGWLVRCDRVDFPPGGVAYRHVHPGPGIRRLLHGELTIDRGDGAPRTYRAGEAWFEGANEPVLATASEVAETAFVRVLLLPAAWAGKRTIRYLDPGDEGRPKLQRATILLEEPLS